MESKVVVVVQATKAAVKQWKAAPDGQSATQREKPPPDSQGQLDRRRQRSVPLSGDWIGRLCLKLERSDMQPRFDDAKKPSYADRQTPSQSTSQPASRLVGWLVGWPCSRRLLVTLIQQRGLKKMKKKKQAKRPQQPVVQQIKNYLQISQPSAMSLWSVNERYSRWEKETERYKSERLETSFTTAKSLSR
ncbi:hypothetical protein T03_13089 [Trichinella britovi]|uniref:Uncharacterized protein n=1 Tax=Trichinella britovi TaxID=45882 RepID=A0A0V1CW95_TRIBR|nr:hypothetical protein T03_13089 [Trichinella britovi]